MHEAQRKVIHQVLERRLRDIREYEWTNDDGVKFYLPDRRVDEPLLTAISRHLTNAVMEHIVMADDLPAKCAPLKGEAG